MYIASDILPSSKENSKILETDDIRGAEKAMKGYNTESGFMGYVDGHYILFACEEDYLDYLEGAVEDAA